MSGFLWKVTQNLAVAVYIQSSVDQLISRYAEHGPSSYHTSLRAGRQHRAEGT